MSVIQVGARPAKAPNHERPKGQTTSANSYFAFTIYYRVADKAFARAAETWKKEILTDPALIKNHGGIPASNFLMQEVYTERSFMEAWNAIRLAVIMRKGTILRGNILSHASKGGADTGLEFHAGDTLENDTTPTTLDRSELEKLSVLPWEPNDGLLVLSGCNTGLMKERGWAPAQVLARKQKVPTVGQSGYAYFSREKDYYREWGSDAANVYLWAYERGRNTGTLGIGSGKRMDPVRYTP